MVFLFSLKIILDNAFKIFVLVVLFSFWCMFLKWTKSNCQISLAFMSILLFAFYFYLQFVRESETCAMRAFSDLIETSRTVPQSAC